MVITRQNADVRKRQRWAERKQVVKIHRESRSLFLGKEQAPNTYTESTWNESSLGPFDSISQAYIKIQKRPVTTAPSTVSSSLTEETENTILADSTNSQVKSSLSNSSTQVESQTSSENVGYGMSLKKMDMNYGEENMDHSSVSSITIGPRAGESKNCSLPMIIMTAATPTPPSTVVTVPQ
ncbi:hypothetical protein VKT23_016881 [Stygiomarasmius scandens]|uniref:Uncharacterized protein n=1 Tax=Marasmiellus scandens TaxID=2682957 RepID=A0ABR1IX12_9AGAR